MEPYERPIYWSVTKVLVSAVVSILEDRGQVDIDKPIETYHPGAGRVVLRGHPGPEHPRHGHRSRLFGGVLRTAVLLLRPDGDHRRSSFWDEASGDNPYTYIAGLRVGSYAEQGTAFDYDSINTYILGWLVEKLTGMPFQDAFSREIWTRIGTEGEARISGSTIRRADVCGWFSRPAEGPRPIRAPVHPELRTW